MRGARKSRSATRSGRRAPFSAWKRSNIDSEYSPNGGLFLLGIRQQEAFVAGVHQVEPLFHNPFLLGLVGGDPVYPPLLPFDILRQIGVALLGGLDLALLLKQSAEALGTRQGGDCISRDQQERNRASDSDRQSARLNSSHLGIS